MAAYYKLPKRVFPTKMSKTGSHTRLNDVSSPTSYKNRIANTYIQQILLLRRRCHDEHCYFRNYICYSTWLHIFNASTSLGKNTSPSEQNSCVTGHTERRIQIHAQHKPSLRFHIYKIVVHHLYVFERTSKLPKINKN
jgi:hypothetical protein